MGNVIKLDEIAAGDELVAIVVNRNPEVFDRLIHNEEFITMAHDDNETRVVGIRFPVKLLKWIDSYSRIAAFNTDERFTRNSVVINFLETMKALIEHRERTEWGRSHIEEIEAVLNEVRSKQEDAGNE